MSVYRSNALFWDYLILSRRVENAVALKVYMSVVGVGIVVFHPSNSYVISEWVLTCDNAHSWQLYSAAPLGDQVAITTT